MGTGVFNGDVGKVTEIDPGEETMTVVYDDREVEYTFDLLGQLELAGRRLDLGHKLCACIPFSCNGVDEKYLFHRGAPSAQ